MTVFAALIGIITVSQVNAQSDVFNTGFRLDFKKSSETASVDEDVVSNVVKATNNTSRAIRFNLDLASPFGWRVVNDLERVYSVAAGDSLFIPVRLIPSKETVGNVSYFISATAYTEFGDALASTPWSVEIKKVSKWNLTVEERQLYFTNDSDSTTINVHLTNDGNSVENIQVNFTPDARLEVLDADWKPIRDNSFLTSLRVGIDTTFKINVRIKDDKNKGYFFSDTPDDEQEKVDNKKYRLMVSGFRTDERNSSKGRRVNFTKLTSKAVFASNEGSSVIPLDIELNSYNVLSSFTNFTLDLSGAADLGNQRNVRYNYQALINTNSVTGTEFNSGNRFLQYSTRNYQVAVGNVGENMGLFVSGLGAKASVMPTEKLEVGAIYASNVSRGGPVAPNDLSFYGGRLKYEVDKGTDVEAQYLNQQDDFNSINGDLFRLQANIKLANKHRLRFSGGYSIQTDTFDPDSVFQSTGYGGDLRYVGSVKKFNFSVNGGYYTDLFLGQFGGSQQASVNARYVLGNGRSITLRGAVNESQPVRFRRGTRFESLLNRRNLYELRYEWRVNGATMTFVPSYNDSETLGLRINTKGVSVGYSKNQGRTLRIFSRFFAGYTEAPDFDINPYPVAKWESRVRYKNLNLLARYNYGPASLTENFRVINDKLNPQSVFISAFATLYFRKEGLLLRPRLNTRYESVFARWRTNFSTDLEYYSKSGYTFTMGAEYLTINQGESQISQRNQQLGIETNINTFSQTNFFLRLGIRKRLGFKRPGGKSFPLKVIVFKDADADGIRGRGEAYVENVLIKINDQTVITNKAGEGEFLNLAYGEHAMESTVLGDTEGWFKSDDNTFFMDKEKTIYIPLTRGVQIAGNVLVQKATYSRFANEVNLSGVKITAIGDDDKVYSGITDRAGQFRLFVPFGKYTIAASSSTIDEQFQFAQDAYELEINSADSNYRLTYYLIEKKRKLNIRKFGNNN